MPAATASPCSQVPYPAPASIAWPKVWPKLSSARLPDSSSSSATMRAFSSQLRRMAWARAPRVARQNLFHIGLEPVHERRVEREAVLDHLGEPGAQLAVGQRVERGHVRDHRARLMEGADHVLAARVVDRGLAADRGVDLREQRGRHLHESDAALVDRRGESGQVADHAAAQGDDQRHPGRGARRAGRRPPAPPPASSLPARHRESRPRQRARLVSALRIRSR